jgi:predicted NAD/FAD-binding protein
MSRARIAVIGTGIAGLSAAYFLNDRYDVVVYEKARRIGGHSRTVTVRYRDRIIPVDTGFIVFNTRNYPNLTNLLAHLDVATKESDMSFALTIGSGWLEWGAQSANAIFGQRRNLVRPSFLRLFAEVMRFNANVAAFCSGNPGLSLGELLARMKLSDAFRYRYLLPMAGAIWSCPPAQMLDFPAESFVRFFTNHCLLSMSGQPQWRTVDGGAEAYVEKLSMPLADRIRTNAEVVEVARGAEGVAVRDRSGSLEHFDHVVFAAHGDETLKMLKDPSREERAALGAFSYQRNRAVLHTDPQFMPKRRRCWASWVYHADGSASEAAICVSYWMNRLQAIDERYPLFVTLNPTREIRQEEVFDDHAFFHPVFDRKALAAQLSLKAMQGNRNTWFCGAHLGYGFHEDGLVSAIDVAERLGCDIPWKQRSGAKQQSELEPVL